MGSRSIMQQIVLGNSNECSQEPSHGDQATRLPDTHRVICTWQKCIISRTREVHLANTEKNTNGQDNRGNTTNEHHYGEEKNSQHSSFHKQHFMKEKKQTQKMHQSKITQSSKPFLLRTMKEHLSHKMKNKERNVTRGKTKMMDKQKEMKCIAQQEKSRNMREDTRSMRKISDKQVDYKIQ